MRTKSLILAAAIGVASMAASYAQTYSVNAVGFINLSIPPGFSMIGNQLNNGDNSVATLLPTPPGGTQIYKFVSGGWSAANTFVVRGGVGQWSNPAMTLSPGEGAFIKNPTTAAMTITLVGEVPQGPLNVDLPQGFSVAASPVPQSIPLHSTDSTVANMGFPAAAGDVIYFYRNGSYETHTYVTRGGVSQWTSAATPAEPTPNLGEGFFVKKGSQATWSRTFSVNQ